MKRCFAMLLTLAMLVGVVSGCGGSKSEPSTSAPSSSETSDPSTEPKAEKENYKIAFATKYLTGSTFWAALCEEVEKGIREGDEYILVNSQEDAAVQVGQIQDLIAQDYDALIVSCSDTYALNPVLEEVKEAGIPVVTVDSSCSDSNLFNAEVMNDNETAAKLCGEELAKAMNYQGKAIVYYETFTDQSITKGRTVQEILEGYGIEVVHVDADGNADAALTNIEAALQAHPDVTGIHTMNGTTAQGAIAALESAGMIDKVFVTCIDGSAADFENLRNGKLYCLGTQQPAAMGKYSIEAIYDILDGNEYEKFIKVPAYLVNKDNVDEFEPF